MDYISDEEELAQENRFDLNKGVCIPKVRCIAFHKVFE